MTSTFIVIYDKSLFLMMIKFFIIYYILGNRMLFCIIKVIEIALTKMRFNYKNGVREIFKRRNS